MILKVMVMFKATLAIFNTKGREERSKLAPLHSTTYSRMRVMYGVQQYVSDLCLRQTGQQHSSFFMESTLLHILHIRLSFGIGHSIIIYSTISKITVRPREIGTGGTGVTSNLDNEAHRGSDFVFYSLIWALHNEWLFPHFPQLSLSPSHYFLSDLMENTTSKSLLGY